jgi:uncharacterized protein with GYD domain
MVSRSRRWLAIAVISVMSLATAGVSGQPATQPEPGTFLLTIFLRHDQSKTLDEIDAQLQRTGFREHFPPPGVEVVSWYVMMGIGQVVTVRVAPDKLRDVNLAIEHRAWGAFRTEFYPTYDYKSIWEASQRKAQ